jgi:Uma2 family endonuclease
VAGVSRRLFNTAEYHSMAVAGILAEDDRVELISGDIVTMPPIGSQHAGCVRELTRLLLRGLGDRAIVSPQNPILLDDASEPQPDVAVLRSHSGGYRSAHPRPADVLLVIEVADTSVDYDRQVKLPLYARAGIPEAWLVRLQDASLEVHRNPSATGYQEMRTLRAGDRVSLLAFPDLALAIADILG